jgi:hypothetical protein
MFDADLAMLYGALTKALNQALFRNKAGFLRTMPSSSRKRNLII